MGLGGIFKVAKLVGRAVAAYYTGGYSEMAYQAATAATAKTPKASAVTGISGATQATDPAADPAAQAAKQDQQKRLALNAGADTSVTPLGVTTSATVTKKKLLGA